MSNPYDDWASESSSSNSNQSNGNNDFNQGQSNSNDFNQGSHSDGAQNNHNNNNSYGGGNNYGGGNSGGYGGNSGGFNNGRPPMDIPIPGKYVPVTIHVGKDLPADKRELLEMMLQSMATKEFTARVAVNNDACGVVRNFLSKQDSNGSGGLKVEYVRPWKKFEVESFAAGDDGWYPTLPVTKSCELLIPALANKDDKARSFKVLEGALICGRAAKQTSRILITYSPDGITSHTKGGKDSAFMQNIIRFAQMFGVMVINLGANDARQRYGTFLNLFNEDS